MRWWILCLLILMSGLPRAVEGAERRVALIIGNDAYVKLNPLRNAGNDARKMELALRSAGFETTLRIDAKRRNLYQVIDAFAMQIAGSPDTVGLFYYAGHGIQANGNNYLIPVDADIETEGDLEAEAVDAGKVLRAMAEAHNRLNIVVLDACRDNPLPKGRSASRGLARMDAPTGTFIAYAAGPGQTAQDGSAGGNGVFTGELVNAIALPGLPIEQVFKRAAQGVRRQTGDKQVPWTEASLQGDFFFHGAVTGNVIPPAPIGPAPSPAPAIPVTDTGAFELAYWNSVKDAKNAAEIKTYLDRYPKGTFAGIAKVKYDELQVAAATPPRVSPPLATPTGAGGRGWLGLQLQAVTPEQAESAGLDPQHPSGGIAMDVEAGGPASRAGIQTGDALVRFDGRTIYQPTDLQRAVSDTSPGKTVDVGILRGGAPMTLRLTVGTAPAGGGAAPQPASAVTSLPSRPPNGFAGELEDFGVRPQSTLQFTVGSVTPTSIPGGRVITTEALTRFNRSALLIDAWADQGHATLPGAIRMPAAGTPGNFFDQIQAGFRQALAMRTNNNPQRPLVFFCAGAECWESYNAALRAVRLGYHEVYWYRGGVASWQAAGLPLYPP